MKNLLIKIEKRLLGFGLSVWWGEDREKTKLVYLTLHRLESEIAERSYDVTFDFSLERQRLLDVCLTTLGIGIVVVIISIVLALAGLESLPSTLGWNLVLLIIATPFVLLAAAFGGLYLSFFVYPLMCSLRYFASLIFPGLSFIRLLRQLDARKRKAIGLPKEH